MPRGQQALNLPGAPHMIRGCLHQFEDLESFGESIPFSRAPSRVADLEVADARPGELASLGTSLDRLTDGGLTQSRQNARVDEMTQRHASSRAARSARAS